VQVLSVGSVCARALGPGLKRAGKGQACPPPDFPPIASGCSRRILLGAGGRGGGGVKEAGEGRGGAVSLRKQPPGALLLVPPALNYLGSLQCAGHIASSSREGSR
jgi:hypothetical protein